MATTKKSYLETLKADPRVESVSDERANEDGIWVYLRDEYVSPEMECRIIHEDTVAKVKGMMAGVVTVREYLGDKYVEGVSYEF